MKYLLLILPFLSFAQTDKTLHYFAGMGISLCTSEVVYQLTDNNAISLSSGLTLGSLAGMGKEKYDERNGGKYDLNDALTTGWGALNGMIIFRVCIDIREKKRYNKNNSYDQELL